MARAYTYMKVSECPPPTPPLLPPGLTPSFPALCIDFVDFPLGGIMKLHMNQIFDSTDERYTIRQVRSVIVQRTFCPLHIRYIFVLTLIYPLLIRQSPLVDRSLSVTYALLMRLMRSLHVLRRPSSSRRRLSSPDEHRINFLHIFFLSVRRPLHVPLSVNM